MSSFNQRVVFSVLLCACSLTSSALAAAKGGISFQGKIVSLSTKATGLNTRSSTIGRTIDSSVADETTTGNTTGAEVTTPTRTCNFSGFNQNDLVNNAYSGGTSANGVSQMNNAITFTGAKVLNTFWGSNEPNAGIVYSPNGRVVVGLKDFSANQISFAYTSSAVLTVSEFSSADGTGTPLNSYTAATTMPYGPYTVWTTFSRTVSANAKSIVISGTTDKWGIDNLQIQLLQCLPGDYSAIQFVQNVEPTNVSLNFSNLGIVNGFSGNNIHFRNVTTVNGQPVDALISSSNFNGSVRWDGHIPNFYPSNGSTQPSGDAGIMYSAMQAGITSIDYKIEFFAGDGYFSNRVSIPKFRLLIYDVDGQSGQQVEAIRVTANKQDGLFGYQHDSDIAVVEGTDNVLFTGDGINRSELEVRDAFILHYAQTDRVLLKLESKTLTNGVDPVFHGIDGDLSLTGPDPVGFTPIKFLDVSAVDCNGNSIPDSCDITSGNSPDVNANGIPDECEAPATLTLTNNAGACNHAGGSVNVDATLSGVLSPIVSGQIYISWNPANMTLNSITAGDAPFNELPLNTINQAAGTALLVTSIPLGQTPVSVISKIVARMQFTILGGTCDGSGTDVQFFPDGTLPTTFTDGFGSKLVPALVASSGFKVDDTSPVFSNVPEAVSVNADAGEGAFARVALLAPTATDACGAVTQTSSRSDGAAMDAMYAVGTTTVTWSSTDLCGNSSTATTSVTVNPYNTARFQVQYVGVNGGAATRSFMTTMRGSQISLPSTVNGVSITNGAGEFVVTNAPIDSYFCATVEDAASTLRRRVSVTDAGTEWNVVVTLLSGDVINDEVVDVLDWGAYVVLNANADLNMDGSINVNDGDLIIANFEQRGDTGCGSSFTNSPEPVTSISIAELVDRGMADLVAADLNNDGWLDMADIELSRR